MNTQISKHFNQTSNRILMADEFLKKQSNESDTPAEKDFEKTVLYSLADLKDGKGTLYVSEMRLKAHFSSLAAPITDSRTLAALGQKFEDMQRIMDSCEDYAQNLKTAQLKPI
jgi:hypothetical protein